LTIQVPIDGHISLQLLKKKRLQKKRPKFLHIITTKGKGLKQTEEDQVKYHAPGKFDALQVKSIKTRRTFLKYQDVLV
jgi:1-deoxy-D-xylulose-5-phosphate synthase